MLSILFFGLLATASWAAPSSSLKEKQKELESTMVNGIKSYIEKQSFAPELLQLVNNTHHIHLRAEGKYETKLNPNIDVHVQIFGILLDIKVLAEVEVESKGELDMEGTVDDVPKKQHGKITVRSRHVLSTNMTLMYDSKSTILERTLRRHLIPKNEIQVNLSGFVFNDIPTTARVEKLYAETYITTMINEENIIQKALKSMLGESDNLNKGLEGKSIEEAIDYMIFVIKKTEE